MALDFVINLKANGAESFSGDARQVAANLDKAERTAGKLATAMASWRSRLNQLAQAERRAAFDRLPVEEKLQRLYARRVELAERLARAGDNERRALATKLRQAENESAIRNAEGQRAPGMLGQFRGFIATGAGRLGSLLALGTLGALAVSAGRQAIDYGGRISDSATRMGVSAGTAQEWEFAASQSGGSLEAVESSMRQLQMAQTRAIDGNKDAAESFASLGIPLEELKKIKPEQLFRAIADNVGRAAPSARLVTDIINVMGRGDEGDRFAVFRC